MEETFVICVGNPVDGFHYYAGADGMPFRDAERANEIADQLFRHENWWVVGLESISDLDDEEEDPGHP